LRLARVLVQQAESGSIPSSINQGVLAEIVGTTRPHVNRFMGKLRKAGHIRYNGGTTDVLPSLGAMLHASSNHIRQ
jgi:CRP-like cAMP-binding protein